MGAGTWSLTGGGADVSPFSVTTHYPGNFAVTEFGGLNWTITRERGMTSTWVCPFNSGTSRVLVRVTSTDAAAGISGSALCSELCTGGSLTIPKNVLLQLPASSRGQGSVGLTLTPDISTVPVEKAGDVNIVFTWLQLLLETGFTVQ